MVITVCFFLWLTSKIQIEILNGAVVSHCFSFIFWTKAKDHCGWQFYIFISMTVYIFHFPSSDKHHEWNVIIFLHSFCDVFSWNKEIEKWCEIFLANEYVYSLPRSSYFPLLLLLFWLLLNILYGHWTCF